MQQEEVKVPRRILTSLLASLSAGVVPRTGAPYIAIGRKEEIGAFLSDLETVSEENGVAELRFVITDPEAYQALAEQHANLIMKDTEFDIAK